MAVTQSWKQFVLHGHSNVNIRPEILHSWQRCKQFGISHELEQVCSHIDQNEFKRRREKNKTLLSAAKPVMEEFFHYLKGGGYLLLLADADGYLIEMMADQKAQIICDRGGISPGARWMEDNVGTTGLSIALRTHTAMATSGTEHYCIAFRKWDCAACPIYVDEEFLGVFDVCRVGPGNDIRELYTLAVSGARAVGERIRYERNKMREEILSEILSSSWDINLRSTGILSFDKWGKIILKNKLASQFINLLQQENLSLPLFPFQHSILDQGKIPARDHAEFLLEGQRYFLESKQLIKQGQSLGTVVLVKRETKREPVYSIAESFKSNQPDIQEVFHTQNPVFRKRLIIASKAAKSGACVLLQGESGTGKDYLARAIHRESNRRDKPFIAINCSSLSKELIASELFGYAPGAFTGAKQGGKAGLIEAANGGTLFLDEIADLPLELQAVLLRTLEEKQITRVGSTTPIPVDVRFIAASHKNLLQLVKKGEFREDLYYRLNVFTIEIPPLRERIEDLESLIHKMLTQLCKEAGRNLITFTSDAVELFKQYSWPGNLRELRNVIQRIVYLHEDDLFHHTHVQDFLDLGDSCKASLSELEQIQNALKMANGNRSQAARLLRISRSAFYRKLDKYGIN